MQAHCCFAQKLFANSTTTQTYVRNQLQVSLWVVAKLCRLTLCDPTDSSLPGSTVLGISQARILLQGIFLTQGLNPRLLHWQVNSFTTEPPGKPQVLLDSYIKSLVFVQLLSRVQLFATPWTTVLQASLSLTISQSLPKFTSIELVMLSNHLILCHPLLLPSIFPSFRVFSKKLTIHIRQLNSMMLKYPKKNIC